jgi:ribokinase
MGIKMPGRIPKVVVVGGTYVDIAIRCGQVPSSGQSVAGSKLSYNAAGPGPTQAAEAALCGCQVNLICNVGGDPFAQIVKASLAEFNINTDFIRTAEAKNTGVVVTLVNAEGENASLTYAGANSTLQQQDINDAEQIISEADVCLIHGQLPQDAVTAAIRCAKVHNVKVILNPARPMEPFGRENNTLPADYFSADIFIPNLYEAADITDQSDAHIHAAKLIGSDLVARGADSVVITMGRRGCMVVDRNGADHIPSFEVKLVDQTGRGDAFAGALAACCAVGDDLRKAVKFASAAGALTCTKFGSIEALPSKAEIIELLQKEES